MIDLFNIYFLVLVMLVSFILVFIDGRKFKRENRVKEARKAKTVGVLYILASIILFAMYSFR